MNAAQLLTHFDRISEAPDAIVRLRGFILDLAVRGRLVPQNPQDEPASELLRRILASKARLIKKQKDTPDIHHIGASFDVPPSWELVPLIALGTWAIGSGFPTNEQGNQDGPYFFLKVSDMNRPGNEKYFVTAQNFIDEAAAKRMRARIHPQGTIVFPKIGGAIATNKRRILSRRSAIDNNCLGITFWTDLSLDWCYLLLRTLDFAQYQAGTAVPALQQGTLAQIPVGLPPVAEQHRIVAKVDELMVLCDQLEAAQAEREKRRDWLTAASLNRLNHPAEAGASKFREHVRFNLRHLPRLTARPDQIPQLRQTILNLAVRGRLIPQDPNDEPAGVMLNRIGAQKSIDEPFLVPESWTWVQVGQIADCRLGKMLDKAKNKGTPRRYLRNVNVRWFGFDLSDVFEMPFENAELEEFALRKGDVLVCEGGEPGRLAVWDEREESIYFQKAIHRVRFSTGVTPRFFTLVIRESADSGRLSSYFTGVGIKHFTGKGLSSYIFPLPPLTEQHRIVARVDELLALCDQLEAQLTTAQNESRHLLESVLHEALSAS